MGHTVRKQREQHCTHIDRHGQQTLNRSMTNTSGGCDMGVTNVDCISDFLDHWYIFS